MSTTHLIKVDSREHELTYIKLQYFLLKKDIINEPKNSEVILYPNMLLPHFYTFCQHIKTLAFFNKLY